MSGKPLYEREELLDLLKSCFGREEIQDALDQLESAPPGELEAPDKILIVLFASRAGSNFFGQLLCGTGYFNEIGESFAPHQLKKIRDRHGLKDLHEAAQWMIDNRGTPRAFGFKGGSHVLAAAAHLGLMGKVIDRAHFVLLRRRDRVAQAVSGLKGKMSGRMHSLQPEGRALGDADYDARAIAAQVERIRMREAQYEEFVLRLRKQAPVYHYEDVCAEPAKHVEQVCGAMGLEMPAGYDPYSKVRLSILRDDLSSRWVERFRAEHPGA